MFEKGEEYDNKKTISQIVFTTGRLEHQVIQYKQKLQKVKVVGVREELLSNTKN